MAVRRKPHPPALRSDPRHRRRDQARALYSDALLRRSRRQHPLPLNGGIRARPSLRSRHCPLRRPRGRGDRSSGPFRAEHHACCAGWHARGRGCGMNAVATAGTEGKSGSPRPFRIRFGRYRGLVTAIVVFAVLLTAVDLINAAPLNYFDVSFLSSGGATLAISAFGETLV